MAALHKAGVTNRPLAARHWGLVLTLCLAVALLLATPGRAFGISGYASGRTAVAAQYPDSSSARSVASNAKIFNLVELMHATRSLLQRDPAEWHAVQRAVVRHEVQALSGGAGADLRQTGSIALLIAAIVVALVGGVVRWRRGDVRAE